MMQHNNAVEIVPGIVWTVAEPAAPAAPSPLEPMAMPQSAIESPQIAARPVAFLVTLAASVIWCIVAAVLTAAGVMLPLRGNMLAYLVLMAGLFCVAFLLLTCPRTEEPEGFWTWGNEAAAWGQCTPARVTYTGRGK